MAMKARSLPVLGPQGFLNIAYWEWEGPPGAPTVLCVHGLTRNGRDFDFLAEALSQRFRVVCPDMPGRGRSDWLDDAKPTAFRSISRWSARSMRGSMCRRCTGSAPRWAG